VKGNKIRALATTGAKRSAAFPDLPTLDEIGIKGFEASAWWGLFAPADTPALIVDKLNAALKIALEDKSVQASLAAQGDEVRYSSPRDFGRFVKAETGKWTQVVKSADLKID